MITLENLPLFQNDFALTATIELFDLDQANIALLADPPPRDTDFAEQLLYCCMVIRQLVNLKGNKFVFHLEQFLKSTAVQAFRDINQLKDIPIKLMGHPHEKPRITFPAELLFQKGELQFKVPLSKKTLFMRQLPAYAVSSITALFYYLGGQHESEMNFFKQLSIINVLSAFAFRDNILTIQNQVETAVAIVQGVRSGQYDEIGGNL